LHAQPALDANVESRRRADEASCAERVGGDEREGVTTRL